MSDRTRLSLSQTPNLNMLLEVMNASGKRGHMARSRDSFGCTPMDYLCLNRMPNSNEVVRRLFQTRFGQVLGGAIDETLAADSSSRKNEIGRVGGSKVKIDKVTSEQVLLVDRQECRIMSGAAVVIPHVLASFS
eukprot:scaffold5562_cov57-Cylindrotheca_fusiformis.AAC.1